MGVQADAVVVEELTKTFGGGRAGRPALAVPHLRVGAGEMVGLIGASGSGKSTLMRHLAALTYADAGSVSRVTVCGRPIQAGGRRVRASAAVRARVGFVAQQFNLVGRLPVLTNVLIGALARTPLWRTMTGLFGAEERARAMAALARVGIGELAHQRASTLSGGQQQRAAIARALVQGAELILADEPIASLDPESARRVMTILDELNRRDGITVVVSLHQVDIAQRFCRRIVALKAGRIVFDGAPEALTAARLADIYGSEAPPMLEAAPETAAPETAAPETAARDVTALLAAATGPA
jgi:phosphonate transport system ATP-binding protein